MGYLNNASVTVDAILTTKGRQKLAAGTTNGLGIAYFALGDDEVDYDLWNPAHPLGSDYYGIVIENMPVLEASPIPEQNLKSKLITLPKTTRVLAKTIAEPSTLTGFRFQRTTNDVIILAGGSGLQVTLGLEPNSFNNDVLGYTVYYDSRYFEIDVTGTSLTNSAAGTAAATSAIGDSAAALSSIVTFSSFKLFFNCSPLTVL